MLYTVAALLLSTQWAVAAAAGNDDPEQRSKHARKALAVLAAVGMNDPELLSLVDSIDRNVDDGYLKLTEDRVMGGTMTLHYELSGGVTGKQLELKFTPDDSNFNYTARPNAVMAAYSYKF